MSSKSTPKREISATIFRRKWFKDIGSSLEAFVLKLLWFYIIAECDAAGVWEVEEEVAELRLGAKINWDKARKVYGEQIKVFDNEQKWWLKSFVDFQTGGGLKLKPVPPARSVSPYHKMVASLLREHGLFDLYIAYQKAKGRGGDGKAGQGEALREALS